MADDSLEMENRRSRISRKLPPLNDTGGEKGGTEDVNKPKSKGKKRTNVAKTEAGVSREGDEGDPSAPRSTRKKRRPRSKLSSAGEAAGIEKDNEATDVAVDTTKSKKTRKRSPRRKEPTGSQKSLLGLSSVEGDGDEASPRSMGGKRKKKRTPQSSRSNVKDADSYYTNGGLIADLQDIEEDVIDSRRKTEDEPLDEDEEEEEEAMKQRRVGTMLQSQPVNKLYIEEKSKFRREDKAKLARRIAEAEEQRQQSMTQIPTKTTTLEFALAAQKVLRYFSLFVHGILAGFAVWQFGFLLVLMNFEYADFLSHYTHVAWPIQIAYYFMFIVCTVSACDRFDVGHLNRKFVVQCLTLQNGAISVLFYFAALILSLSIANTDDKIQLYSQNATSLNSMDENSIAELTTWRNVNIARGVMAIVAWFVIALQPKADRLSRNLRSGEENIIGGDTQLNSIAVA